MTSNAFKEKLNVKWNNKPVVYTRLSVGMAGAVWASATLINQGKGTIPPFAGGKPPDANDPTNALPIHSGTPTYEPWTSILR